MIDFAFQTVRTRRQVFTHRAHGETLILSVQGMASSPSFKSYIAACITLGISPDQVRLEQLQRSGRR